MDISSLVNNTPPPTSDVNNTQTAPQSALFGAIDSATPECVRQVLREICATNPEAFRSACDKLLVANDAAIALPDSDMKRKRETHQLRYEICVQCEEEYDVLDNEEGACEWHPGTKEPDDESGFWDDHDEDAQGEIDSDEMRETYPEGYLWTCCSKRGDEEGCRLDAHAPDLGKRRKSGVGI